MEPTQRQAAQPRRASGAIKLRMNRQTSVATQVRHRFRPSPTLLVLAALALALAGWFVLRAWRGTEVTVATATRGDLTQTVVATGRVTTPAKVDIGAMITGTITDMRKWEGDRVAAGDLLVTLRADEADAAVRQARAAVIEAERRLTQIDKVGKPVAEQALRQAQSNLRLAELDLDRQRKLQERGFIGQSRVDEAVRALETARAQVKSAEAQAQANQKGGAEYALALARLDNAHAALKLAGARLANTRVVAPVDGVILQRLAEPGDVAQAGRKLYVMQADGETRVYANVDEKNLGVVAPGQPARAVTDAFPMQPFDAELYYVAPGVDAQRGTVEVRLRVPRPPAFLKPDMTVSVEVSGAHRKDVVIVPTEAVRDAATPEPWVLVVKDGRAVRQPVAVGLKGEGKTEILTGVEAGDRVILPAAAPVTPGDRVHARAPA
jgi:HlyD family secretion protein